MNGILTGFFGAIVEAWAQLRIGKLRVLLSLVGVAAAVRGRGIGRPNRKEARKRRRVRSAAGIGAPPGRDAQKVATRRTPRIPAAVPPLRRLRARRRRCDRIRPAR